MARQGTSSTVNNHSPAHSLSQWNEGTEKSMLRSIQARVSQLKLTHDIKTFTLSIHCTRELVQAFLETPPGPVYAEVSMKNALQAIHVDLNSKMEAWSEWDSLLSIARYDKIREVILDCANRIPVTEMAKSMWRQILTASMNYDRSLCSQIILGLFSSGIVEQVSTLLPNETQDFLNICQALIDAQVPKHRKIERYLKILVQHTGILPQYLFISNTKRQGVNPLMGGGFADVWRGELNQQLVALKVLRIFEQGERRRKILQDFCNEAMIWRQLNHENVLPFYGVSADEFAPRFAMVLPWMSHGNMMAYLKTHPDVNRVPLVSGVAAGLRYLHDLKPQVIHGDLRGVNVLIDEQQRPRIADFGLARVIDSQATTINSSVADGRGNLRWQAPELLQTNHFGKDSGKFTTESDVYSFACVILEIFTDEPPFAHLRTDGQVLLTVVMSDERPPHPGSLAYDRGLTDDIWQLMQDCWKTERLDRPSMSAVMKMVHSDSKVTGTSEQTTVGLAHPAPNFMLKMLHVFDLIGTQTQGGDIEVISPVTESLITPNKTATARTEPDSVPPANVEPPVLLAIPAPDPPPLPKNASPHLTSPISPTHRRGLINPYSRTVSEARELMVQRRDESIGSRVAAFSFEIGTIPEHLLNRRSRGVLGPTSDPRGYSASQSGGPRLIGEDESGTRARREQRRSKSMSSDSSESRISAVTAYRRALNSHDTPSNVDTSGWFGKMIARIGLS